MGAVLAAALSTVSGFGSIRIPHHNPPRPQGDGKRDERNAKMVRGGKGGRKPASHYAERDPFYGIAGRGRRGAVRRMLAGEFRRKAELKRRRGDKPLGEGRIFLSDARQDAYEQSRDWCLANLGCTPDFARKQAIAKARRIPAKAPRRAPGRPVPVHASGPGA